MDAGRYGMAAASTWKRWCYLRVVPTQRAPRMVPYPTATGLDPRILRVAGMIALSVGAASLVVVSSWQEKRRETYTPAAQLPMA